MAEASVQALERALRTGVFCSRSRTPWETSFDETALACRSLTGEDIEVLMLDLAPESPLLERGGWAIG